MENIQKNYEIIIGNIFQNTFQTDLWKTTVQKKVNFNLNKQARKF